MTIRVGIAGYGNLGRGVESAISQNEDMELVGVFSRRNPEDVKLLNGNVPVHKMDDIQNFTDKIDVLILCGGSKNDLPEQGPALSALFNTVDSFDTHAKIPEYFAAVDASAKPNGKTAHHFRRLGSRFILHQPFVWRSDSSGRCDLHVLGQRLEPRAFRCS